MVQFTRVSGSLNKTEKAKRMVEEFKYGQMAPATTVSGVMEWQMAMVVLSMLKVTFMKANGLRIRQMAMVSILILMVAATKDNGMQTSNMALVLNNGLMEPSMMASMNKV